MQVFKKKNFFFLLIFVFVFVMVFFFFFFFFFFPLLSSLFSLSKEDKILDPSFPYFNIFSSSFLSELK